MQRDLHGIYARRIRVYAAVTFGLEYRADNVDLVAGTL
jgi:hypothetical protein